jgi:hypothetical protein
MVFHNKTQQILLMKTGNKKKQIICNLFESQSVILLVFDCLVFGTIRNKIFAAKTQQNTTKK